MENQWNELDTQLMVMAAHRDALKGDSLITGSAVSWIWKYRKNFEKKTVQKIILETICAVDGCEIESSLERVWVNLASNLYSELTDSEKKHILDAVDGELLYGWPLYEIDLRNLQNAG